MIRYSMYSGEEITPENGSSNIDAIGSSTKNVVNTNSVITGQQNAQHNEQNASGICNDPTNSINDNIKEYTPPKSDAGVTHISSSGAIKDSCESESDLKFENDKPHLHTLSQIKHVTGVPINCKDTMLSSMLMRHNGEVRDLNGGTEVGYHNNSNAIDELTLVNKEFPYHYDYESIWHCNTPPPPPFPKGFFFVI